jgi:hypothetical protein
MNKTVKVWCIRCLCGEAWVMDATTEHTCTCGAKLVRTGETCHAEVDTDKYDISAQPYQQPGIYQYDMAVRRW